MKTPDEIKKVLSLYRGDARDRQDPEIREALDLAAGDPGLKDWLEKHLAFHAAMRGKLRQVEVPAGLKETLLARRKIVRAPVWWRQPAWAAAAAVILLSALAFLLFRPEPPPDRFANFEARIVRTALRQYRMDIETNDMQQVRQLLASRGAPADYEVPRGLRGLKLTGGGALKWRSNPVSMVCFDRGDQQMLYFFIADRRIMKDPPTAQLRRGVVSDLVTASWSDGDKVYLLAGPRDPEFEKKYL
jgi:hypothetical protein